MGEIPRKLLLLTCKGDCSPVVVLCMRHGARFFIFNMSVVLCLCLVDLVWYRCERGAVALLSFVICLLFLLVLLVGCVRWLWLFLKIFYTIFHLRTTIAEAPCYTLSPTNRLHLCHIQFENVGKVTHFKNSREENSSRIPADWIYPILK